MAYRGANTVGVGKRRRAGPGDDAIVARIIQAEGTAYTNDPDDAGGPTKFGITLAVLQAWRAARVTAADVEALTRGEAENIYRAAYILPFDALPDPLRANVIDMGVNAGVVRSTMLLQQLIGVDVDGKIGPQTRAAAAAFQDANDLFVGFRLAYYENLIERKPTQIKYRRGWRNRALGFLSGAQPRTLRARGFASGRAKAYDDDSKLRGVSRKALDRTRHGSKNSRRSRQ